MLAASLEYDGEPLTRSIRSYRKGKRRERGVERRKCG